MTRRRFVGILIAVALFSSSPAVAQHPQPSPILLSRQLATHAHAAVGDVITLATDRAGRSSRQFRVAGIYEPTPDPMHFTAQRFEARMHLPDLVDLSAAPEDRAARDSVSAINVKLANPADGAAVTLDVMARMPGLEVRPTTRPPDNDPFAVLDRFHLAISVVTMIGSTAFLLALMIIRADERRETVGAMRLLGISRRSLLIEVAVEGLAIAGIGAVFGIVVAVGAEGLVNRVFQARYDTALVFLHVTPSIAIRSLAVAMPLGIAAGVGASWTLLRRNILSLVGR